jgi:hypothetical protein
VGSPGQGTGFVTVLYSTAEGLQGEGSQVLALDEGFARAAGA